MSEDAISYGKEEFYRKIDRGMEQVRAGYGVVKSMDERKGIEDKLIQESGLSEEEYCRELQKGLDQVHAGYGITKTMAELEAMTGEGEAVED